MLGKNHAADDIISCEIYSRPHNFADSSISYCVLPLVFVQGNNHAADDINSCEYTVNAAGHINLCCLDLRIFTVYCPNYLLFPLSTKL